jgi:Lrp/AsnC family transcriptional regulator
MDSIDRNILALLQDDASLSIAEVATRVGLTPTPCWKRIQRLEKSGVLQRRVALLSPEKLGLGLSVYVSIVAGEHSDAWLEKFTKSVSKFPEVVEFYRMAGDVDYMLRVVVSDMVAFDEFYKRLIAIAPLRNVVSRFAMERIKATTALPIESAENLAAARREQIAQALAS